MEQYVLIYEDMNGKTGIREYQEDKATALCFAWFFWRDHCKRNTKALFMFQSTSPPGGGDDQAKRRGMRLETWRNYDERRIASIRYHLERVDTIPLIWEQEVCAGRTRIWSMPRDILYDEERYAHTMNLYDILNGRHLQYRSEEL